jgi:hypothetical protein
MKQITKLQESEIFKPLGYKVGSLEGVRYEDLVGLLGEPTWDTPSGDDKVQKEWVVKFGDKQFTIYDWKTYDVEYTMNELEVWSVGGTEPAFEFISTLQEDLY